MTLTWSFSLKLLVDSAVCVVGDYACVGTASVPGITGIRIIHQEL